MSSSLDQLIKACKDEALGRDCLRTLWSAPCAQPISVGPRAVLVHAKDDAARAFYEHFNFEPSPTNPYHLFVQTKDLEQIIE